MGSKRPTKEDLSAFIYLTDQILASDFKSEEAETGNIYKIIATEGSGLNGETIDERSIRRAFNLRKNLKAGEIIHEDYVSPQFKTLNTLTYFHYDKKSPKRFRVFKKIYKIEIEKYSQNNYPSDETLNLIFEDKPKPEKFSFLNKKIKDLEGLLNKVVEDDFKNLKQEFFESNTRFEVFQKKVNDDLKLQNDIIEHLRVELTQVEKQRKKATLFYRFLGAFGLFLVSINYDEVSIESVLDNFIDDYEGLDEDTILEDLT